MYMPKQTRTSPKRGERPKRRENKSLVREFPRASATKGAHEVEESGTRGQGSCIFFQVWAVRRTLKRKPEEITLIFIPKPKTLLSTAFKPV